MGWLFAKYYDRCIRGAEEAGLAQWRAELLAPLTGRVLEIGAGTGANIAHYPASVDELLLCEPDRHMRRQLDERLAQSRLAPIARVLDLPGERIPAEDDSLDAVVSTLVLCTVRDLDATLREVRRVLRPGGQLVFLEHIASEDARCFRRQRWIQPLWKWWAAGCHLTRKTGAAIEAAGFELELLTPCEMPLAPAFVRPAIRGVARVAR